MNCSIRDPIRIDLDSIRVGSESGSSPRFGSRSDLDRLRSCLGSGSGFGSGSDLDPDRDLGQIEVEIQIEI